MIQPSNHISIAYSREMKLYSSHKTIYMAVHFSFICIGLKLETTQVPTVVVISYHQTL